MLTVRFAKPNLSYIKEGEFGTLVLSLVLVLEVPILHICLAIHLDHPVTPVSRLSKTRMLPLETLMFKAVMNK